METFSISKFDKNTPFYPAFFQIKKLQVDEENQLDNMYLGKINLNLKKFPSES